MSTNPDEARLTGAARSLSPGGLIAITWCGAALAFVFVALRCYARITELRKLHTDDYWLIGALFFLFVNAIMQTIQTHSVYYMVWVGAGWVPAGKELQHQGNYYVRLEYPIIVLFWTVTWCVKASFLAMYYRLFEDLAGYRRLWWVAVVFTTLSYIGCWISGAYSCHPPTAYYHFGRCEKPIDLKGSLIAISYSTTMDVLTDLVIMALPIRVLRLLNITARQKLALGGVFGVGFIVVATALVRLSQIIGRSRSDPVGLAVWGVAESSIAVVVGSLPPLKGFIANRARQRSRRRSDTGISSPFGTSSAAKRFAENRVSEPSFSKSQARMDAIQLAEHPSSFKRSAATSTRSDEEYILKAGDNNTP